MSAALTRRASTLASNAQELQRRTSSVEDPLGIGKESESVSAPTRWLLVLGTTSSGKTSLIRQLKCDCDGLEEAEALRYVKEVHKAALDACREVLKKLPPLGDEMQAAVDRVHQLRRRSPITSEVASDLEKLWSEKLVVESVEALESPQQRQACKHFATRLKELAADGFVPDMQDLLHIRVPTMGQQETRLQNFPGGPVNIFELKTHAGSLIFDENQAEEKHGDLLRRGLCGVVFVASVTDAIDRGCGRGLDPTVKFGDDDASSRTTIGFVAGDKCDFGDLPCVAEGQQAPTCFDEGVKAIDLRKEATTLHNKAKQLAARHNVPCISLLSKVDLLQTISLPGKLSSFAVKSHLESQLNAGTTENDATEPGAEVLGISLVESHSNFSVFQDTMMRKAFPDDLDDDEAVGLQNAAYLTFFCYNEYDKTMLSFKGALPTAKVQADALGYEDYLWLQRLPNPLPNPRKTSSDMAKRLGKESRKPLQRNFWNALEVISGQLGNYKPEFLGAVHAVPLLACSAQGALLVAICQTHTSPQILNVGSRLAWRTISQVAQKIKRTVPAIERYKFSALGSYKLDAEDALLKMQPKDLDPVKWLGRLRDSHSIGSDAPRQTVTEGTYVCAFYALSALDGFRVLLHEMDHSITPAVKISNHQLSAADWKQLCTFGRAVGEGVEAPCPDDWAAAKSWMGPEVSDETQFTTFQKFMYGVVALRQRLGRHCSAMHDELRYSQASRAPGCLSSLGSLYTQEMVTLGKKGEIQIIMVTHLYNLTAEDTLPAQMNWYPLTLFEARHYSRFCTEASDLYCHGKHLLDHHVDNQSSPKNKAAVGRDSGLASSAMRTSSMGDPEALRSSDLRTSDFNINAESVNPEIVRARSNAISEQAKANTKMLGLLQKEGQRLESAWEPLRWTKRLVKAAAEPNAPDVVHELTPKALQQAAAQHYGSIVANNRKIVRNVVSYTDTLEASELSLSS